VAPGGDYEIDILHQPIAHPDDLSARTEFARGWFLDEIFGEGVLFGTQELQINRSQREPEQVRAVLRQREY
jgi:hypothetical protein